MLNLSLLIKFQYTRNKRYIERDLLAPTLHKLILFKLETILFGSIFSIFRFERTLNKIDSLN